MDETKTGDTPEEETTKEVTTPTATPEADKLVTEPTESKDEEKAVVEESKESTEDTKAKEGKENTLQDLDRKIYEKREELRKMDVKPPTEEAKPTDETRTTDTSVIDEKLKPLQDSMKSQREEYSNLALREISSNKVFGLINAATEEGQTNYTKLKEQFQQFYPDGFGTKEGYVEAIERTYAFLWPSEHAGAVAEEARKSGEIDMLTKDRANIGGTSSSQKKGDTRTLTGSEKKMLDVYNKDRPKDKQMTEEEFGKYSDSEESPIDLKPF